LLTKIKNNDSSCVVLNGLKEKVTMWRKLEINHFIDALAINDNCQLLYMQNIGPMQSKTNDKDGFGDEQLAKLTAVLKTKKIWGLNLGELSGVSANAWTRFANDLLETNITHLYVSEHTLPSGLKKTMQVNILKNKRKHDLHDIKKNKLVVNKCRMMWRQLKADEEEE